MIFCVKNNPILRYFLAVPAKPRRYIFFSQDFFENQCFAEQFKKNTEKVKIKKFSLII